MQNIEPKLNLLRYEMEHHNIDMYMVPSIDSHNSEYVPACFERRTWISGFDGSAGEALVTLNHAYLWTDGRYFLQAEQQLDSKFYTLMRQGSFTPETEQWIMDNAQGLRVGFDPKVMSIGRANQLKDIMESILGEAVAIDTNLIDNCKLKSGEELAMPVEPLYLVNEEHSGKSTQNKIQEIQKLLKQKEVDYLALNVLDEIAWVFNIRGSDISFNPLVISYALISQDKSYIFVDKNKLSTQVQEVFAKNNIHILAYEEFGDFLAKLNGAVWLDDRTANYWMYVNANQNADIYLARSPVVYMKACKNDVEISGMKHAHIKDAVAEINFLHWLDNSWQNNITELDAVNRLGEFRQEQTNYVGDSFATISGYQSNGAIIHYRVTPETNKQIKNDSLYLIDSGGQYLEGTTDITRTVHLGTPTEIQKKHYTLVLKGHLALGGAKFPHGTFGEHLDVLARKDLWNEYLNYRHGTGHGVGCFLCVHEGPQKISQAPSNIPLLPGMIVSNEPGLYIDGDYGIRIENLCLIKKATDLNAINSLYGPFYEFEDLTLVPYSKKLIMLELLTDVEKQQIKDYYSKIISTIRPKLKPEIQAWLDNELDIFG